MKKIGCLLLAMAVGLSGILSGVTTQAAEGTAETAKYVVVLDPGHGGAESGAGAIHNTESKKSTGRLRITPCRHLAVLRI